MAQRDMRDRLALQRIQAQSQQGQAYGQMFQQMAMLAAYFKHQQGAGLEGQEPMQQTPAQSVPQAKAAPVQSGAMYESPDQLRMARFLHGIQQNQLPYGMPE